MLISDKINQGTIHQEIEFEKIIKDKQIEICQLLQELPNSIVRTILDRVTFAVENYSVLPVYYKVHTDDLPQ